MTKVVKQLVSKTKKVKNKIIENTSGDNAPDYKNNLYFEPKMTWEDFIKYCDDNKVKGIINHDAFGEFLKIDRLQFYKSGRIKISNLIGSISKNRTFEQYKEIIHNLYL